MLVFFAQPTWGLGDTGFRDQTRSRAHQGVHPRPGYTRDSHAPILDRPWFWVYTQKQCAPECTRGMGTSGSRVYPCPRYKGGHSSGACGNFLLLFLECNIVVAVDVVVPVTQKRCVCVQTTCRLTQTGTQPTKTPRSHLKNEFYE